MISHVSTKFLRSAQVGSALAVLAAFGVGSTPSEATTVTVTPTSMGSWAFDNRDSTGTVVTPTTGSLVNGPATPPLGTGSANLTLSAGSGDGGSELRSTAYDGVLLSSLTALTYSTYDTVNNGSQFPYLAIEVNWNDGGTTNDDRLFFEPPYQVAAAHSGTDIADQPATALNTWQTWDALSGGWWANSDDNSGHHTADGCAEGTYVCTLTDYLSAHSGATITNTAGGLGGVEFRVGFASAGDAFNGYVDNFTIGTATGTDTYNFEAAAATPIPAALPLFASGLGFMGLFTWRRKRKAAAAA